MTGIDVWRIVRCRICQRDWRQPERWPPAADRVCPDCWDMICRAAAQHDPKSLP